MADEPEVDQPQADSRMRSLHKAIEGSYKSLEWARNVNHNLVQDYHGPAYGRSGDAAKDQPINKINQAVDVWTMLVAANRPRVSVTTNFDMLRPFARHYEQAVNNLIGEIRIEDTIRRWVLDAFFMVGVVKVHLKDSAPIQFENDLWMDPGTPFASNVSLDNWVFDTGAKKWSEVKYAGDMYRIPMSDIEAGVEQGMYDPEVASHIKATSKFDYEDTERLEAISRGEECDPDEFEPMVDLCDIWVARDRKVYTFAVRDRKNFTLANLPPLAEMDWTDPECGPYHMLGFNDVPENILPISPISHIQSLNQTINSLCRKQMQQGERQKENPVYSPAGKDTIAELKDAPDGMAVKGDPKEVGLFRSGGADQGNQALMLLLIEILDGMAGNLPALAGLGPQAKTYGQEQLIQEAGNRKVGQMQQRVVDAVTRLVKSLGFMLWEDQFKEITSSMPIDGTNYSVTSIWKPGEREGNFYDYNFDTNIYSLQHRPPAARAETLLGLLERVFIPMMPMMMQQGTLVDFPVLVQELAVLLDIEPLRRIVTSMAPPSQEELEPQTSMAAKTTRTHVRQNISTGGTQESRLSTMRQALQGQNPNSQQMNAVSTPMGN